MDEQRWQRAKDVFNEAREKPAADRAAFVAETCAGDDQMQSQVEALLEADDEAGAFLASPTMDAPRDVPSMDTSDVVERLKRALAGRYSLEGELGRGGMGIVFLARDVALERRVAIKLLPPELAAAPDARERFLREARTAAGLSHPNIVPIHLVEEREGLVYFVMTYVDGESLGDRVRRAGPLKPADAAKVVQEVAWALAYAHSQGVIHRDIKPDNIMIDSGSGRALVSDFGIARVTTEGTMTQPGDALGTLQYMSPEQASADGALDGRSDLYSLGVTAFFALTGRLPFESQTPAALVAMHIADPAPPLKSVNGTVPARLAEAVDRCLAKEPSNRYPSGEALADAIAAAQVARKEIAPSVREFLSTTKSGLFQVWALGSIWAMLAEVTPRIMPSGQLIGNPLDPIILILSGLTVIVVARWLTVARGVVRAGLDEHDVAAAVGFSTSASDANVEYEVDRIERLAKRLATPLGRAVSVLVGLMPLMWVPEGIASIVQSGLAPFPRFATGGLIAILVGVSSLFLSLAYKPRTVLATFTRGTPESGKVWGKLWAGPFGRWLFKLVGIGVKKGKALPSSEAAHTEVLLGRAASDLAEKLPKAQRARLGDLHEVIRELERAAIELRTRRDELDAAIADVGAPEADARRASLIDELQATKGEVEARLASAVGALENLRLDLLRLRAGVGTEDDLTGAIQEARAVGEAVDLELAAQEELESALSRPR